MNGSGDGFTPPAAHASPRAQGAQYLFAVRQGYALRRVMDTARICAEALPRPGRGRIQGAFPIAAFWEEKMKITPLIAGFALVVPTFALGQSNADLAKGSANTSEVLNYGMGYDLQRYSPLKQITAANVKKLAPVWHYSLDDNRAEESQALVHKGVLYITTHAMTAAVDVKTGKQLWRTKVEYPADVPKVVCCGIINRGAA